MERWFEFMGHHPFLFGTMFVLIVLFFMLENKRGGKKINPNAVGLMVNNQNAQLIEKILKKAISKAAAISRLLSLKITLTHFAVLTILLSSFAKWV